MQLTMSNSGNREKGGGFAPIEKPARKRFRAAPMSDRGLLKLAEELER